MRNIIFSLLIFLSVNHSAMAADTYWQRHTIDPATSEQRGADGVRLADVNGDSLPDVVTGWEEGNAIRVCLNPGPKKAKMPWPAVTAGHVKSAEDAVFADLDGDGSTDVVSCTEGKTKTIFVHWAPRDKSRYLDSTAWETNAIPVTGEKQMWMFAVPMQIDGRNGLDLFVGSKGSDATIGWLQSPENPRDLKAWKYHKLRSAGWIMSLDARDMDGDGDCDLLFSDRKGQRRGVGYLENPGEKAIAKSAEWQEVALGGEDTEVMFLDVADLDGDGETEVLVAGRNKQISVFKREKNGREWAKSHIANPFGVTCGKAVAVGDIDLDGRADIVHSSNTKSGPGEDQAKPPVTWLNQKDINGPWQAHAITAPGNGFKFDLVQLLDLDGDGDLDVVSCEEIKNLGVFWYENPMR